MGREIEKAGYNLANDLVKLGFIDEQALPDLQKVIDATRQADYGNQEVLYREGEGIENVNVIHSGMVKLLTYLPNGRARIVRLHSRGAIIGLNGLLGEMHEHTAMCVGDAQVYHVPIDTLKELKDSAPTHYTRFIEQWYNHLNSADTWITEFSTGSIRSRVARLILFLSNIEEQAEQHKVWLLTSEEMSEILGVTPESVSRVVAEFKRAKILTPVEGDHRETYLCDVDALEAEAEN